MRRGLAATVLLLVALAGPARADTRTVVKRYGPIALNPYEVERGDEVFNIPTPGLDGDITHMKATLVYADGTEVPIANTMLHHVVMANVGRYVGDKQDPTCNAFRRFDSQTYLPLRGERFYGLGEERHELELPDGYGYPIRRGDKWAMTYMLMNHKPQRENVFIQYTMDITTGAALTPVKPVWLDVRNCNLDPGYDVPGGAPRGARTTESTTWTAPEAGRIVFSTGHLHGGGRDLRLTKPACGQTLLDSKPLWGLPSHPYYNVRPLLHEPGPISMTNLETAQGIPVAKGETLRLDSIYDAHRPHARVMGILLLAFTPDPSVAQACAPLPTDERTYFLHRDGRKRAPVITVPITERGPDGKARVITRPPGRTVALRGGGTVDVAGYAYSPANLSIRRGQALRWQFYDSELHNVSFASGPRAFSSDNLDDGGAYRHRFTTPGTYRLFCTLHPTQMAATVRVRP